jgi:hypothetical protein
MRVATLIEASVLLSCPPHGSVIVRREKPVEGPGGRWVPCVTTATGELYLAGLFQVGPGCKHVCAVDRPMPDLDDALVLATKLAASAAA